MKKDYIIVHIAMILSVIGFWVGIICSIIFGGLLLWLFTGQTLLIFLSMIVLLHQREKNVFLRFQQLFDQIEKQERERVEAKRFEKNKFKGLKCEYLKHSNHLLEHPWFVSLDTLVGITFADGSLDIGWSYLSESGNACYLYYDTKSKDTFIKQDSGKWLCTGPTLQLCDLKILQYR